MGLASPHKLLNAHIKSSTQMISANGVKSDGYTITDGENDIKAEPDISTGVQPLPQRGTFDFKKLESCQYFLVTGFAPLTPPRV